MVTGGKYQSKLLDSTEVLTQGNTGWGYKGVLPSARLGLKAATLDNKLIVTGKSLHALILFVGDSSSLQAETSIVTRFWSLIRHQMNGKFSGQ